jgi:predicted MFS family arabinose efflux permease
VAILIGGLIAEFISFRALFLTMGCISLAATIVQVRLSWLAERALRRP